MALSPRNQATLRLYEECRLGGVPAEWRSDRLLMRNFADLAEMDSARERRKLAEEIGYQTAMLMVKRG
jgi:hypothetical protein